jgi:hypothetical protein
MRDTKYYEDEITKLKAKISGFQTRLRDMERRKTEAENSEIVAAVRGEEITPEDLSALLKAYKNRAVSPTASVTGREEVEE